MTIRLRICMGVLSASLMVNCATPVSQVNEAQIRRLLPGTWGFEKHSWRSGGSFEKTYFANGTAVGQGRIYHRAGATTVYSPPINFTSKWSLAGNNLTSYDVQCSTPGIFPPGKVYIDRILNITSEEMEFQDLTNGGIKTDKRLR